MKALFFIFQLIFISTFCLAQSDDDKASIALMARGYPDHVVLRYFPTTPVLLNKSTTAGYVIEKAVYKTGIPIERLTYTPLKDSPFKRWSDEEWEKRLQTIDKNDTTNIQLAGFAMALSDPNIKAGGEDVLAGGLKSLKEERDNQDMKFAMVVIAANQNKVAAEGLALRITDTDVKAGIIYVYRVRINDPAENTKKGIAYIKVQCSPFNTKYLANNKAVKVTEGDENVSFTFPESKDYYAFNVERSDDGGTTYKKITGTPALKLTPHGYKGKTDYGFVDSNLVNYKKYHFRVLVSTPFADNLLLTEFVAMPRDRTPPPSPFLKSATNINPKEVELLWETKEVPDLKGFTVKRSSAFNGKYISISKTSLPKETRNYIDEGFDSTGPNYYIVEAVDTSGNVSQSFPAYVTLIDSIPPAVPVIALAVIDTVGKITIKIKPNTEKDFMGYQLLKANARDHEFSVVLETFRDSMGHNTFTMYDSTTLNTLSKNIFYKVIAFDTHFNQSVASKIIELKRRDTIPPISPLITGFGITDSTVVISFVNSGSEDAISNVLLRRENSKDKFMPIFTNKDSDITRYVDKNIVGGRQYEYAMIAKDDAGLSSKISRSITLKTLLNNKLPVPLLSGTYDDKTKKVSLFFKVDEKLNNRKVKVEIYKRADKKSAWTAYKIIDFEKGKTFTDEVAGGQKGIIYTVKLTDEKKNSSNFSNEVELKF